MKIAQLNTSRAQGTQELDHLHLSIKFKRRPSRLSCSAVLLLTQKIYVALLNSKECREKKLRLKNCSDNLNLCI